jgi:hypothetical protein
MPVIFRIIINKRLEGSIYVQKKMKDGLLFRKQKSRSSPWWRKSCN